MFTVPELAAKALGAYLAKHVKRRFGSTEAALTELIPSAARLALDCIGNTNALYHTVEHTMLVTLVGYDIMKDPRAALDPVGDWHISVVRLECTPRGALQLMSAQCPPLRQDRM